MDAAETGKLIRECRMEKGLTQQALAETLHVSAGAVSKWENGHSFPDISVLEPLSDVLGVSISEIVMGKRRAEETNDHRAEENEAISSVIGEAVRQRRRGIIKWTVLTLAAAAVIACGVIWLFIIGPKAKQADIRVRTEFQENSPGITEWVINFETIDGRALYPYTEETYAASEDGEGTVEGRLIHLRIPPFGHANTGSFSWGYFRADGQPVSGDYDFYVIVDYADGQVRYSMREEGLFERQAK